MPRTALTRLRGLRRRASRSAREVRAGRRSAAAASGAPRGSGRSGAPSARPGYWRDTQTSATSPANGASTVVSIFMLSSTDSGSPVATGSPACDEHGDHECRPAGADDAAVVALHAVRPCRRRRPGTTIAASTATIAVRPAGDDGAPLVRGRSARTRTSTAASRDVDQILVRPGAEHGHGRSARPR